MGDSQVRVRTAVKTVLVATALFSSALIGARLVPTQMLAEVLPPVSLEDSTPGTFAGWTIDDSIPQILPDPTQQELLDKLYNSTLTRTYVAKDGYRIMYTAAYGKKQLDDTLQLHSPEVCYAAQGFQVSAVSKNIIPLDANRKLNVHQLKAVAPGRPEAVTYWIIVGEHVANSRTEQKKVSLGYGFKGFIPDGLLVRVSSIDNDPLHAHTQHSKFISDLYTATPPSLRARYFGSP